MVCHHFDSLQICSVIWMLFLLCCFLSCREWVPPWQSVSLFMRAWGLFGCPRGRSIYTDFSYKYCTALVEQEGFIHSISCHICIIARPNDSAVMASLICGSLSGIASSTGKSFMFFPSKSIFLLLYCLNFHFSPYLTVPWKFYFSASNGIAIFPIDLVRRRMQLEGAGGRARVYNTGLFGTLRHIIQAEGLQGLYRGILPEYSKVVPSVGILFMTNEALKMLLSRIYTDS